ncbi:hypothetical protein EYF80_024717 [Liparis tanakae]|uniref:Uncharacterized protein n=1 Tax=Liparis tanakae TaxID=230148 RepID=A0A4Z2HGW5_9TELE|nr:hypothetical protein EYF80_024717 [Liparis tanakae]
MKYRLGAACWRRDYLGLVMDLNQGPTGAHRGPRGPVRVFEEVCLCSPGCGTGGVDAASACLGDASGQYCEAIGGIGERQLVIYAGRPEGRGNESN